MYVIFNIVIIGLVLLIAYWWANQGLFSALLHLLCVVVAGAIAIGLWEPIVVGFLLRGGGFDNYAWGVALVGVFAVALFILRMLSDRLVPANVDLPHWANLTFGFPVGAAAGILTMGIVVIGAGMMQSTGAIMGYRGYLRSSTGEIVKDSNAMWLPVHELTASVYGWLSVTTLWSSQPLQHYYPRLHWQSSLLRDSYEDGKGQLSLPPDEVTVTNHWQAPQGRQIAVELRFGSGAMDFGEKLTVSNAQIRLIGNASGRGAAETIHPQRWIQDGQGPFLFDDLSHVASSTPGREDAKISFIFDRVPGDFQPRFVQVKGVRYPLPNARPAPAGLLDRAVMPDAVDDASAVDLTAQRIPDDEIRVSNDIRPARSGKNTLPAGIEEQDGLLTEGYGTFVTGGIQVSRSLQIKGVFEPTGTKIVWLDVSRGAVCNVYDQALRAAVGDTAMMTLVDTVGVAYTPIGFIHETGSNETNIKLDPKGRVARVDELPHLPTSGTQRLRLYFRITEGVTLQAFNVGDVTLGTCQLTVQGR